MHNIIRLSIIQPPRRRCLCVMRAPGLALDQMKSVVHYWPGRQELNVLNKPLTGERGINNANQSALQAGPGAKAVTGRSLRQQPFSGVAGIEPSLGHTYVSTTYRCAGLRDQSEPILTNPDQS
ncbi:MAG TPA: hypothetical protein VJX67_27055 [Blastocatellia bacterium]|nr:hypothetical protein [Blastocatellia bacterium]